MLFSVPFSAPAEKRRDFLEMNPHLRGKLPPLKKDKAKPGVTPAPSNASAQSQANNSQPKAVNTRKNVVQKKKPKTKKKTVLESLILRRKNKKRTGKHKISGRFSSYLLFEHHECLLFQIVFQCMNIKRIK